MALNFEEYNPVYKDDDKMTSDNDSQQRKPKRKEKPKKKSGQSKSWMPSILTDKRLRYVLGFAILLFAAYLLLSGISYFSNGDADQSLVESNKILENAQKHEIKNYGGPLGATLAEFFFNKGFGLGAFCIIYMFLAIGLKLIGQFKYRISSTLLISSVATVTLSSLFGLAETASGNHSFYAMGGAHGYYLNEFLYNVSGMFGCIAVNLLLIAILIALTINMLTHVFRYFRQIVANYRLRQMQRRSEEEQERINTFDEAQQKETHQQPIIPQTQPDTEETNQIHEQEPNPLEMSKPEERQKETSESNKVTDCPTEQENPAITLHAGNKDKDNPADIPIVVRQGTIEKAQSINEQPFDPTAELSKYKFPPTGLLQEIPDKGPSVDIAEQEENKERITKTLSDYGIQIRSIEVCVGPTVTLYEIIPAEGVRIAKIKNLEDDIALSLSALGIRIIAPIPGKGTIGIEVPNREKRTVSMKAIIESKKFQDNHYDLPIAMGSTISNEVFIADLTKMPHILVAGATGQGKSVGLNAIVTSLLYKKHPSELKFVMIDPKMVEFSMYSKLEYHYIAKMAGEEECIITDMNKAVSTLKSLVVEMENRLLLLRDANVRNIKEYNDKFVKRKLNPEKGHKFMPYIVVIIDELADLIMNIGRKEVETPIARITQKARAVGIHMILATQRPSTDIITGVIKANCPGRIAFRVTQMVDSRTIIDRSGAQQLIGRGDMLISYNNEITRVQCAFVDTPEVEAIANYIEEQVGFEEAYELPEYTPDMEEGTGPAAMGSLSERDSLFEEAAAFIVASGQTASTSSLQRRYSIGYNRAGKIMDQMEAAGIVGPSQGGKPRQVLIDSIQLTAMLEHNLE